MLLSFQCNNFKSFQDGFIFNMIPERMTEIPYSILSEKAGKKEVRALSASVIYGPNAAGKTSIVNAMSCFRQIVAKRTLKDSEDDRSGDHVSANMSLIPFGFAAQEQPTSFAIDFVTHGTQYRYELSFTLGKFLEKASERKIQSETLSINQELIFHRTADDVEVLSLKSIQERLNIGYDMADTEKQRSIMGKNLSHTSLLLTTDFNSFCSKAIVSEIKDWFAKQFVVINSSDRRRFYPHMLETEGNALIDVYINQIAKEAGIIGSDFAYTMDSETHTPKLISVLEKTEDRIGGIDSELIESVGTMRLISIMPAILGALKHGAVLVMDELDASLHPMMVMNLITLFHNDEVNINHAQLIFNTHNPIYLNNKLLRRDEIKFVERDKATKSSCLYALSDFKANGEASVRKTSDYMKNYFVNRYGAIENMDFTDIVMEMLSEKGDS